MTTEAVAVGQLTQHVVARSIDDLIALDRLIVNQLGKRYDVHPWGVPEFELDLPGKWDHSWCATDPATKVIVGYVVASEFSNNVHAHRVAVHPNYRRNGIGIQLFNQLFAHAKMTEFEYCTAQVPYDNNAAFEWYLRHGFHVLRKAELKWYLEARGVTGVPEEDHLESDGDRHWVVRYPIQRLTSNLPTAIDDSQTEAT
ncbi:MAG: N-acetyltransferase [Chloroflexi bacterium]|nr:N-acetyltransferase [Chloroflexota bacterium]MDA1173781.1 N-acetyltransferase [Chloroflexota bacterium]